MLTATRNYKWRQISANLEMEIDKRQGVFSITIYDFCGCSSLSQSHTYPTSHTTPPHSLLLQLAKTLGRSPQPATHPLKNCPSEPSPLGPCRCQGWYSRNTQSRELTFLSHQLPPSTCRGLVGNTQALPPRSVSLSCTTSGRATQPQSDTNAACQANV